VVSIKSRAGPAEQTPDDARAVGGAQSPEPGQTAGAERRGRLGKALFVALGLFFVGLAVVGIVLPLIPTTAPLLLAAALVVLGIVLVGVTLHILTLETAPAAKG
jgi:hypothetical protein